MNPDFLRGLLGAQDGGRRPLGNRGGRRLALKSILWKCGPEHSHSHTRDYPTSEHTSTRFYQNAGSSQQASVQLASQASAAVSSAGNF